MKTKKELEALTREERLAAVREWAAEMLRELPEVELSASLGVHRIGAEFPEWMLCRTALERMRDYPHSVYALYSHENTAPITAAKWLPYPGLLTVQ